MKTKQILIKADEDVVQGEVSDDSIADAQTLELDEFDQRATVQYQLGELFDSIQEGEELPAWASPAVRRVSAVMQQRGMGASSMASLYGAGSYGIRYTYSNCRC